VATPLRFEFATATRIIFGAGSLRALGPLAKELGQAALVVTGRTPGRAEPFRSLLREQGIRGTTFSVPGEPEVGTVRQGVALARSEKCDLVISFGGGSALDAGKAIAAMLTNEGELLDYLEVIGRGNSLTRAPAPFLAIPTTAGTGSEATRNAVLASPQHRVKVSLRSPLLLPRIALVDPELTYDLPPAVTASTGLDALTQLIEPYVCSRPNPVTDALCMEGMRRAACSLRTAFQDGRNTAAREDMAVASLFGGLALANAGLGAVHGFAGPVGGMFPAPHGAVCAALLPHVMEMNLRALRQRSPERRYLAGLDHSDAASRQHAGAPPSEALPRYQEVARVVTGRADATADAGVEWVRELVKDLAIPGLSSYGIKQEHVAELVEKSAKASSMKANPIVLTREELAEILHRAL
jgi:alcohol dehydrogenase class IV